MPDPAAVLGFPQQSLHQRPVAPLRHRPRMLHLLMQTMLHLLMQSQTALRLCLRPRQLLRGLVKAEPPNSAMLLPMLQAWIQSFVMVFTLC